MRIFFLILLFTSVSYGQVLINPYLTAQGAAAEPDTGYVVMAWYAEWMRDWLPPDSIDYTNVTHVIHFACTPNFTGGFQNYDIPNNPDVMNDAVTAAHNAGVKILVSCGGWYCRDAYLGSMSAPYRATFINNLLNLMRDYGYDGIDLDMEDMYSSDESLYQTFVTELRDSIDAYDPTKWLSCAVGWEPQIFAGIWEKFDVINLMTYDMSGAWGGWVTWHNAATYNGGLRFPSNNKLLPNATSSNEYSMNVDTMVAMGVPYNRLTIGLDFYGYIWRGGTGMPDGGATGPFQEWSTPPTVESNVSYYDIMDDWYTAPRRNWDTTAGAVYLSINNTGSSNDRFISYDDEETAATKIAYIKSVGLKGLCIWELGGGWRQSVWPSDALLQSVGDAMWP